MSARIGFDLDVPEEEDDEEGEEFDVEMVGDGCADFVPCEPHPVSLDELVKAARKLRKLGARRIKIGDMELDFE